MKVLDSKSFIHTMKDRSQDYNNLRVQLEQVKRKCNDIVNLDDQFKGKGADAIKGFYQAQIDVIDAWLRLIDRHIAFLNGIQGSTEDKNLSGNTIVHFPLLEDELVHHIRNQKEMVASQQDELQRIFNRIDDLISLNAFSTNSFDDNIEKADKGRKDTIDAVNQLDQDLTSEYKLSESEEQYIITLFQQLIEASRKGNTISPIHFNSAAYKASDVYQLKAQAEQQTINYLGYKKNQEEVRKQQAEIEAQIEARKREKAEFAKLNPFEKSIHSFKEIGNDFWDGLEARNEKKFDSVYDFGNYLTIGSFNTAKTMYQGMEDRAHVAMNTPYDFVNYISMGTLDLGNGAINPEESFSKEHWLSSIGLASILAGGAKPIVRGPKTPSLQDRNLVLEKTIDNAHELTMKTKSHMNYVVGEVRGGIHVLLNEMNDNNNLAYSLNGEGFKIPFNVLDTETVKKVMDWVFSRFSLSGVGKGVGAEHMGRLKGKEVLLRDILEREVTYTKRNREEFKQLRNKFNSSVRKNFLQDLASDEKKIKQLFDAGLTEIDINNLKSGLVPDGYQVHHKLPLDDGGTNDFKNLILIKNDPYHKVLTNSQKELTKGMKVGDSINIKWPIPEGFIYPTTKK